ncbi:hypothetical protein N6H14_22160 [Paenibacillus sp. CC-CFT747]|nr:hypothetical protein N6H14_22160 [Paenibacillus sp. CC-CFT747]
MGQWGLSARPKVNRDTYYTAETSGRVYFRNNQGTFRMEGEMIDRWVEKLLPMFNGQHSLETLTKGFLLFTGIGLSSWPSASRGTAF